ncbi:MAG: PEP-CTERM sorting domain-containing protein [Planctomycetota bacterium]
MHRKSRLRQAVGLAVKPYALCLTTAACLSAPAMGETIVQYNFNTTVLGSTTNDSQLPGFGPSTLAAGLSVSVNGVDTSNLIRPVGNGQFIQDDVINRPGVNVGGVQNSSTYWDINGFYPLPSTTGQPAVKDDDVYLSFSFTPDAGQQATVEELSFGVSAFGGGPGKIQVEVYDGGVLQEASAVLTVVGNDVPPELAGSLQTFDFADFTTSSTVEFRLFGWEKIGGGNNSGLHIEDWTVTGSVVPEPSSLALAGLGLLTMIRRRR